MPTKFNIGDCLERPGDPFGLICEILEVRPTGYTWRYLRSDQASVEDLSNPALHYRSDDTGDPFFARGWFSVGTGPGSYQVRGSRATGETVFHTPGTDLRSACSDELGAR